MVDKTLRVCLFQDLPNQLERDSSYLYLAYDKLLLFFGQNQYDKPYVICETLPSNPMAGYLYILFDGTVQIYINGNVITIAEIEESYQAEYLVNMSTTYFFMADKRNLDQQTKTFQLSYKNSTYIMAMESDNSMITIEDEVEEEEDTTEEVESEITKEPLVSNNTESLQALWGGF